MRLLILLCASVCVFRVGAQETPEPKNVAVENPRELAHTDNGRGDSISGVTLSPDGTRVALYGIDSGDPDLPPRKTKGKVQIWDVKARKILLDCLGHADSVQKVMWSRDGKMLASQSQDGAIFLWDAQTGKSLHQLAPALLMPTFGSHAKEQNQTPEQQLQGWKNVLERPQLLGFSPDGLQVLALTAKANSPEFSEAKPVLRAWNVETGKVARNVLFGSAGGLNELAVLNSDGRTFTVLCLKVKKGDLQSKQLEIRDINSGELQSTFWAMMFSIIRLLFLPMAAAL